jgi:hypothetical protein
VHGVRCVAWLRHRWTDGSGAGEQKQARKCRYLRATRAAERKTSTPESMRQTYRASARGRKGRARRGERHRGWDRLRRGCTHENDFQTPPSSRVNKRKTLSLSLSHTHKERGERDQPPPPPPTEGKQTENARVVRRALVEVTRGVALSRQKCMRGGRGLKAWAEKKYHNSFHSPK